MVVRAVASPPTAPTTTKERSSAPVEAPPAPAPDDAPARPPQFFPGPDEPQWPPQRPFVAVALDNLLDSVTDVARHVKRMGKDKAGSQGDGQLVPGALHAAALPGIPGARWR